MILMKIFAKHHFAELRESLPLAIHAQNHALVRLYDVQENQPVG
jgi:hypothetical protein